MNRRSEAQALRRRASIAFGIGVIALVFLLETSIAHRTHPSAASPYVWAALVAVAAGAFARGAWLRRRAARLEADG